VHVDIFLCSSVSFASQRFQPDKFRLDPKLSEVENEKRKSQHEQKFIKVAGAYDVLGDKKKKDAYDNYGQNGLDMLEKGQDPAAQGFGGGGFGGGGGRSQGFGEQTEQKPREAPPLFKKYDSFGVVLLGDPTFPDASSKNVWLLLFYDKGGGKDQTTKSYVSRAKELQKALAKKANQRVWEMIFKVGALDCSGKALRFCQSKLGTKRLDLPVFATVLNGRVGVVDDAGALQNTEKLHDYTTDALLREGLVVNINSAQHIQSRLLEYSSTPGHPTIAILLLSENIESSPLYASLAYHHRADGFSSFGESRGGHLQLGEQFSVQKYPALVALFSNLGEIERFEKYNGGSNTDAIKLSRWLSRLSKKHFKS